MTYEQIKERILAELDKYHAECVAISDDLADHPEVSRQEFESSKKYVALLEKHGYAVEYPFAGLETAFRGIYGPNDHKYKIGVLAEYDALPEIGHACGHCMSGAMSVLTGLAMKDLQDELNADIHIIGTPDEEDEGGKCVMINEGVFDNYDMTIMIHLDRMSLAMPQFQALGEFFYEFHGKAAHASAAPWDGRNALNGAQLMLHAIDMLRQHVTKDAQFHSIIKEGGDFPNIVPEKAVVHMFIRAGSKRYMEELIRLADDAAQGAARATQTTCIRTPEDQDYYVDLQRNQTGEDVIRETMEELGIEEDGPRDRCFGSSDIGNVSYACPAFQPCLKVVDDAALHTREFADAMKSERTHKAMKDGAAWMALAMTKIFTDEEKIAQMKADFAKNFK